MDILALIDAKAASGDRRGAAADLARGLMMHSEADPFRQGYTLGNALIAVAERFELSVTDVAIVAQTLVTPLIAAATEALRDPDWPSDLTNVLPDFGVDVTRLHS